MDIAPCLCSETDDYEHELHAPAMAHKELHFVNEWLNDSLATQIERGVDLRYTKSGSKRDACDVAELSVDKEAPYCDSRRLRHSRPRTTATAQSSPGRAKWQQSPVSSKTLSPTNTVVAKKSRPCSAKRPPTQCPLRIAELAIPSKRQCLETWRSKCHMLPDIMLDRLKQIIMDQKTIAHIPDAIDCFRVTINNNRRAKRAAKKCESRKQLPHHMESVREFCAVFGHKIANKLIAPRNIVLNSELQNLSQVVYDEIGCIIKCNSFFYRKNVVQNKKIHQEMSDKIASWIASILEETSEKLLEEELRVKKIMERIFDEDYFETLIGRQTQTDQEDSCRSFSVYYLEEEEGPVLDILDDLITRVMSICYKEDSAVDGMMDSEVFKEYFDNGSTPDNMSISSYGTGDSNIAQETVIKQFMQNELGKVIDTVTLTYGRAETEHEENHDNEEKADVDNTETSVVENDAPTDSFIATDDIVQLTDGIKEPTEGHIEPLESLSSKDGDEVNNKLFVDNIVQCNTEDTIKYILNSIIDQANVSEVYVIIDEESPIDRNKNVKFTDIDMALVRKAVELSYISDISSEDIHFNIFNQPPKKPYEYPKPHVTLAPPNDHLLSDADESWPMDDILTPMLRVSQSVCKSITSLGKIMEDEYEISACDEMQDFAQDVFGIEETINVLHPEGLDDIHKQHENNKAAINSEMILEITIQAGDMKSKQSTTQYETISTDKSDIVDQGTSVDDDKDYIPITKEQFHSITHTANSTDQNIGTEHKIINKCECFKDIGKGDNRDINEKNIILVACQHKMKIPAKVNYRVNPQCAPSWVRCRSSEDSISQSNVGNRNKGCTARKWTEEIIRAFETLEQWNIWMDTTCRKIIFLKQREVMNRIFSPEKCGEDYKDWVKFKKSIDIDLVLWKKLNNQLKETLNVYQNINFQHMLDAKQPSNTELCKTHIELLNEVDRMCLWTHRMIVSAEYNVKCNCRNQKNQNKNAKTSRKICHPNSSKNSRLV